MKIEILPSNVANMIAAGEVVQGPYSVVKEMMENSVDAGASSVTVIVSDSGRTLIRIIDDGGGMSREDAVACFERHATSKISRPEDLESGLWDSVSFILCSERDRKGTKRERRWNMPTPVLSR